MAKYRKSKPKPLYQPGQMLAMRNFIAPDFYAGDFVSVIKVQEATFDVRYLVRKSDGREGWIPEDCLALPLEVA